MHNSHDVREASPRRVYQKLRAALIAHEFAPGERLTISEIAARYGVSITPVREAMSRLQEEKLIELIPSKGYFFRVPDLKELSDIYHIMQILLVYSGKKIANSPEFRRRFNMPIIIQAEEKTENAGKERSLSAEKCLEYIISLIENDVMLQVVQNALVRTHFIRRLDLESEQRFKDFRANLSEVQDAIVIGDPAAVDRAVTREISRELELLPTLLREIIARPYFARKQAETVSDQRSGG